GAGVAENWAPQACVRTRESQPPGAPELGRRIDGATMRGRLLAHLGAQATTTLTATPCRCGRNVARLSSSKTKVPPGLMAWVVRIRSLASHATVQAWRHSPSTKRMTVPLGPTGPGGPAAPGGPCSPFSPWGPATCFSSQAESAKSANSRGIINTRTCMGGALPRYPAGYGAQEVKILLRRVKRVSAMPAGSTPAAGLRCASHHQGSVAVVSLGDAGGKSTRECRIRARTQPSE